MKHIYVYILDCWILLIFDSFYGSQMTILGSFGGPWAPLWHNFATKRGSDARRGIRESPSNDFQQFLMDLGCPFGHPCDLLFDIFWQSKRQISCLDCRHVFVDF